MATSLGNIYIFQTTENSLQLISQIQAHEGPTLKIDYSHPKFGSLIASCGFDGKIYLWKENNGACEKVYEYQDEEKPTCVNYVKFSKYNNDLLFASGNTDGNVVIHTYKNEHFSSFKLFAHEFGVNAISFSKNNPYEFASCGNDNLIKIWGLNKDTLQWECTATLDEEDFAINDIAFKNSSNDECLASCREDGAVNLWWKDGQIWKKRNVASFDKSVSQISFNENGTCLTAVCLDGESNLIEEEKLVLNNNTEED